MAFGGRWQRCCSSHWRCCCCFGAGAIWRAAGAEPGPVQRLTKLPDAPPCFCSTRTPWMTIPRSTALHMSQMVSSAICTAVRASISTPLGPTVSTVAVHDMPLASVGAWAAASNSIATRVNASGWHSGISSLVFFAACMPAMRATPSTSPLRAVPVLISASVSGNISIRPQAMAMRWVAGLAATSTMCAWPWASKWVSADMQRKNSAGQALPEPSSNLGREHHTIMRNWIKRLCAREKERLHAGWAGRLRASGIHLGISLGIAALAALLVFGLWYPYPYRDVSGGRTLFLLVVSVDVIMGPLITLAIFNRTKRRRELVLDFTMVGMLQLAALGYGLWTVFVARPVHLVFEYSRMSVVHAIDVDDQLLAKAPPALQKLPITGPTLIALRPFKDADEQYDATMAALDGAALPARCDLWQPYASSTVDIPAVAKPITEPPPPRCDLVQPYASTTPSTCPVSKPITDPRHLFAQQTARIDRAVADSGQP